MVSTIIGIDPGAGGGIAWFRNGEMEADKFDGHTEADIALLLSEVAGDSSFCYLEKVGPNRGKGERRQGASSMFSFGDNNGFWRGLLTAYRIPYELVRPQVWLPAMGLRGVAEESQTEKKNRHKAMAQRLYPNMHITHATADAVLLATYGMRISRERGT